MIISTIKNGTMMTIFLLYYTHYHQAKDILYQRLGISGTAPSLSDLCDLAVAGNNQARCLVVFILRTDRF